MEVSIIRACSRDHHCQRKEGSRTGQRKKLDWVANTRTQLSGSFWEFGAGMTLPGWSLLG